MCSHIRLQGVVVALRASFTFTFTLAIFARVRNLAECLLNSLRLLGRTHETSDPQKGIS
jgi:hypothetical protein